ncbi:MAG TPA: hypothetical protein PLF27_00785 [Sedimentibacter sp.]|nr:hypothetical protein [Sedimentibacter sp.]
MDKLIILGLAIYILWAIDISEILSLLRTGIIYIIIGFFLLSFLAMIDSFKIIRKNKKSLVQSNNKDKTIANTEKELIELISRGYYRLEEKIAFSTYYAVNPEYIINLLSKKKIFQGNNKFSCTVTTNTVNNLSRYEVEINI